MNRHQCGVASVRSLTDTASAAESEGRMGEEKRAERDTTRWPAVRHSLGRRLVMLVTPPEWQSGAAAQVASA